MTKKRGNKTPKAVREIRKQEIVASLEAGKRPEQIRRELNLPNGTFYRYVAELSLDYANLTSEHNAKLRERMAGELAARADDVLQGKLDPKSANAWVRIVGEFNDLLGLKAPTKSVVAHLSSGGDMKFRKATFGLTEDQLEQVYAFAAGLPREKPPITQAEFFEVLKKHQPQKTLSSGDKNGDT